MNGLYKNYYEVSTGLSRGSVAEAAKQIEAHKLIETYLTQTADELDLDLSTYMSEHTGELLLDELQGAIIAAVIKLPSYQKDENAIKQVARLVAERKLTIKRIN